MELFWVTEDLAVVSRPRGGDGLATDITRLRNRGVDVLVSCLTPREDAESDLEDEASAAHAQGMEFVRTPIDDHGVPKGTSVDSAIDELHRARQAGRRVAVHCWMGLGRSPLIAAALLITGGMPAKEAIERVSSARGVPVPETEQQQAWLLAR